MTVLILVMRPSVATVSAPPLLNAPAQLQLTVPVHTQSAAMVNASTVRPAEPALKTVTVFGLLSPSAVISEKG